jgi:hypothetical protein
MSDGQGVHMPLYVKNLTFDAEEPLVLARFWASMIGSDVDEGSTPDKAFVEAPGWGGPTMWFNRIAEAGPYRNKVHMDLRAHTSMETEVDRLCLLGATVIERGEEITRMSDPEGNAFCVELSPSETAAQGSARFR